MKTDTEGEHRGAVEAGTGAVQLRAKETKGDSHRQVRTRQRRVYPESQRDMDPLTCMLSLNP